MALLSGVFEKPSQLVPSAEYTHRKLSTPPYRDLVVKSKWTKMLARKIIDAGGPEFGKIILLAVKYEYEVRIELKK